MAHLAPRPAPIAPDPAAFAARGAGWIGRSVAAILEARQKAEDRDITRPTVGPDPIRPAQAAHGSTRGGAH